MIEKYRLLFFRYLYEKLKLNEIEKKLEDNKIEYITDEKLMCQEEILCKKYSKYFYLLNKIDLSFIKKEEIEYLKLLDQNAVIDNDIINFLERTYVNAFFHNSRKKINYYGIPNDSYFVDGDCLILGLKYDELGFATGRLKTKKEIEKNDEIINDITKEIETNQMFKVKVIRYNELYEIQNIQEPIVNIELI